MTPGYFCEHVVSKTDVLECMVCYVRLASNVSGETARFVSYLIKQICSVVVLNSAGIDYLIEMITWMVMVPCQIVVGNILTAATDLIRNHRK